MSYFLGVDLGTTYTAAASLRDGRTSTIELGTHAAAIPSVVYLREDETIIAGDAASRRGASDPGRVAREFKRRVGDTTPILLGGSPYSAEALMGRLLRWVVDAATEREGAAPAGIAVTHPANWGPYKQDLLSQAISRADLDGVVTITEPEAAVTYYASQERVEPGSVIAVYDLGGGTFDAAVVRKTADGVEGMGSPEGIERLGGVDFDEAIFSHVLASLGGAVDELDVDDPAVTAALVRLRSECVSAKEALSADTEVTIHVLLPNFTSEVRLTRAEFEAMIRPPLADSITAMRRALRSAGVDAADLHAVLLAGGSSRIPLVAQLVGGELGRPVAVDAHPKHGVALGAALAAGRAAGVAPAPPPPAARPDAPAAPPDAGSRSAGALAGAAGLGAAAGVVGAAAAGAVGRGDQASAATPTSGAATRGMGAAAAHMPTDAAQVGAADTVPMADVAGATRGSGARLAGSDAPTVVEPATPAAPPTQVLPTPPSGGPPRYTPPSGPGDRDRFQAADDGPRSRRGVLIAVVAAVAVLLVGAAIAMAGGGGDSDDTDGTTTSVPTTGTTVGTSTTELQTTTTFDDGGSDDGGEAPPETTVETTTTSSTTTSTTEPTTTTTTPETTTETTTETTEP